MLTYGSIANICLHHNPIPNSVFGVKVVAYTVALHYLFEKEKKIYST